MVVGHVGIECTDTPVTEVPGIGPFAVGLESVRFGESHDVQPVSGPAFAVMRVCQDTVDQLLPGLGPVVVDKCIDRLG